MLISVRIRRLTAATLVCAGLVLGVSVLLGTGRAQASSAASVKHVCSMADRQFLQVARDNMTQLGYWGDELVSGDATPAVVIKQSRSESDQIAATRPTDPSLGTARSLLRKMFLEYGAAVRAKALGSSPGVHVQTAYTLANAVHDLLVAAQPALAPQGCDVTPLLQT
jgi:hypothetical protein